MIYNYKQDYKHIFDTPAKMEQETVVVSKIMELLNNNKFDNIYDFINNNQTYQDFLKKNELENVVKHFGNTLNEQDFKKILDEMVKITEKKKSFNKETIKTTTIGDEQFVAYEGEEKTTIFDNSNAKDGRSIERELEELQKTQRDFQTVDADKNTDRMFQEVEKSKKETLNLQYIKDIDPSILSEEEVELLKVAAEYQLNEAAPIKVDLQRKIIVDEFNNIMKIEKVDDKFIIVGEANEQKDTIEKNETKKPKTFQKSLTPNPNTIYSDNH